ncbi:amidohydrolase [Cohnella sp. CIP 111063]|uniref:M20 metallopeptidase family protein n=1 Tax=unclassified Cohnella TaxID=2636738 RepID=UPI000B8BCC6B|nr:MULTISPECIES: M20 family metallopeptidase [unclassified Cohnella]OXS62754.1 amidohydrolase [Cohnella sp. CIP 111063]PRX75030.1 hippurate hydrolase [Cohnella sp. SGD-V74]
MTEELLGSLRASAAAIEGELVALRRKLHAYPELSFEEERTSAAVAEWLDGLGLDVVRRGVGGHGIVAELAGTRPGPRIALRADMDALPIQEESSLPYASQVPGVMHACGHDAHTAMLCGAVRLLANRRDRLAGSVRFLFQSAEEINAGAKAMIEQGALDGVDEIYGLHNLPTLPASQTGTRFGALMGSVDQFELTVTGRGGHGALPEQCVDPVVAASAIVMALQTAVSRELSPFSPAVVTVGSVHGGASYNVIPERVELAGTVRTFSADIQEQMPERLRRLIERTAQAYRCEAELRYIRHVPVLVNDDACVRHAEAAIDAVLGRANRIEAPPVLAGEDFSVYLQRVPGCFFWLGSGPKTGAERAYGLHHPRYTLNEDCLPDGAAVLAAIALGRLGVSS